MSGFPGALLRRQLILARRRQGELFNPLLFALVVVVLFPLGIGPDPERLSQMASGLVWVVALLSTLLALEGLFRADFEDGSLEQLVTAPRPLYLSALVYVGAHWLVTGLPLALLSPLFGLLLRLPADAMPTLLAAMALGSATLCLLGAIGAALTVCLPRGGLLIALVILPLYIPVLIFGSAAVQAAALGADPTPQLLLLAGLLSFSLALSPFAVAAGLRLAIATR